MRPSWLGAPVALWLAGTLALYVVESSRFLWPRIALFADWVLRATAFLR